MALDYLHNHPNFDDLIQIVASDKNIEPSLVEKDYWIMHCLYGLKKQGFKFELKGGTSLSKGFNLIHRFSEDIDIHIEPPVDMDVPVGKNHDKEKHIKARADYYDWLVDTIQIDGIVSVTRDHEFDDQKMRSGGIRLHYPSSRNRIDGLKEGILLEVGFDNVAPNAPKLITSWAYEYGSEKVASLQNRAESILCYLPQYTFVEKIQTISTKYRNFIEKGEMSKNFMRHYYDLYCLLENENVQKFIGTEEYYAYKKERFPKADELDLEKNLAFNLENKEIFSEFEKKYISTYNLYYRGQIPLSRILSRIAEYIHIL